jgi:hypothetical protein
LVNIGNPMVETIQITSLLHTCSVVSYCVILVLL